MNELILESFNRGKKGDPGENGAQVSLKDFK